jgi:hypothetical protein
VVGEDDRARGDPAHLFVDAREPKVGVIDFAIQPEAIRALKRKSAENSSRQCSVPGR